MVLFTDNGLRIVVRVSSRAYAQTYVEYLVLRNSFAGCCVVLNPIVLWLIVMYFQIRWSRGACAARENMASINPCRGPPWSRHEHLSGLAERCWKRIDCSWFVDFVVWRPIIAKWWPVLIQRSGVVPAQEANGSRRWRLCDTVCVNRVADVEEWRRKRRRQSWWGYLYLVDIHLPRIWCDLKHCESLYENPSEFRPS